MRPRHTPTMMPVTAWMSSSANVQHKRKTPIHTTDTASVDVPDSQVIGIAMIPKSDLNPALI